MTQPASLQPSEVAALLGVDAATVRRWAAWHKEHLSTGAAPAAGGRRAFTSHDVAVLQQVQALRIAGLTTPAINERLYSLTIAEIESPQAAQKAPESPESAHIEQSYLQPLQGALQPFVEAQQAQQQRIERLEKGLQTSLIIFGAGTLTGALVMGLLALLVAVLLRQ